MITQETGFADETKAMTAGEFKPMNALDVHNRDSKFAYRWIKEGKINPAAGKDHRGWEKVCAGKESGEGGNEQSGLVGTGIDSCIRSGDLVLARMPKEKAKQMSEYYQRKNNLRMSMVQTVREAAKDDVAMTFEIEKRKGSQVEKIKS